jgi:hypothetical protein
MGLRVRRLCTGDVPERAGLHLYVDRGKGKMKVLARLPAGMEEVDFWIGLGEGLQINLEGIEEIQKKGVPE